MKKTFRALRVPHKWALMAMLDAGDRPSIESVKEFYEINCPERSQEPLTDVMEELTECFLKVLSGLNKRHSVDWIHPSFKDLVIEEVARQPQLRKAFLKVMSLAGIKIAISTAGGSEGDRAFPFLTSSQGWQFLPERCASAISVGSDDDIADLLTVLAGAHLNAPNEHIRQQVEKIIHSVCSVAREKWDRQAIPIGTDALVAYCKAGRQVPRMPSLPQVERSWQRRADKAKELLEKSEIIFELDVDAVCDWARFARLIFEIDPRLVGGDRFSERFASEIAALVRIAEEDLEEFEDVTGPDPWGEEAASFRWHADLVSTLASALEHLAPVVQGNREKLMGLVLRLRERSLILERRGDELEAETPDDSEDPSTRKPTDFSVRRLFFDL
jgi:predicted transcriptional regulator